MRFLPNYYPTRSCANSTITFGGIGGELLFARIWLIVEGETDVSVFAECADIIGVDLHAKGVRIVECSQAGGPGYFHQSGGCTWYTLVLGG